MLPAVSHPLLFSDWLELSGYIKASESREAISVHDMGVPRHLQVPLSVDTSISYEIDTSMFPGLDDPRYRHEPVLMIASNPIANFGHTSVNREIPAHQNAYQQKQKDHSHTQSANGYNSEFLGDLLETMDITTQDLLFGLKNTEDYLSLVDDVIQGLPHFDELRYLEGPESCSVNINSNISYSDRQSVSMCTSKQSTTSTGYHIPYSVTSSVGCTDTAHRTRAGQQRRYLRSNLTATSHVSKDYCVSTMHVQPQSDNHPSWFMDSRVYTKRKRVTDSFSSGIPKRTCFGDEQMGPFFQYHSNWRRYGNGVNDMTYGNPVIVM